VDEGRSLSGRGPSATRTTGPNSGNARLLFRRFSLRKRIERGVNCGKEPSASISGESTLVLVADRDVRARSQLARVLGAAGFQVAETASGEEALKIARRQAPVLTILEVPLGGISGYEVCRSMREELGDDVPVIFLSGTRTESYDRVAGFLAGADDYVVRPYAVDELLVRIRRLVERRRPPSPSLSKLTPREREVLRLLAEGLSAKEIAGRLFISSRTVGTHVEHILTKLNVRSRVQAVAIAYRDGLAPADLAPASSPDGGDTAADAPKPARLLRRSSQGSRRGISRRRR
jgi:DNA-binding NarL/FixJ family response regulator